MISEFMRKREELVEREIFKKRKDSVGSCLVQFGLVWNRLALAILR